MLNRVNIIFDTKWLRSSLIIRDYNRVLFFLLSQPACLKSLTAETYIGGCDKSICHRAVALREMFLLYPTAALKLSSEFAESITQPLEPPKKTKLPLW